MRNLLFLLVAACVLSACNLTNIYIKRTQKKYDRLEVKRWTHKTDSAEIHWRKIGSVGTKALLIHGFGPLTELQWEGIAEELHQDFILYIPDLIYFGESSSQSGVYDPNFLARQIETSVASFENDPLLVVGFSYGGLISSIYAHNTKKQTTGLVLIDALSPYFSAGNSDSIANAFGYETLDDIMIPENGKAMKALLKVSFYKPKRYPTCLLNQPAEILYSDQKDEKKQLLNYLEQNESSLKSMDLSWNGQVQVIWGKDDLLLPVSNAYKVRDFYHAELTVLPEAGHVVHMEHPEKVAEAIRRFAEKLDTR